MLNHPPTPPNATAVAGLRRRLSGRVVAPEASEYDDARAGWNLTFDQRPALVVMAADAGDVAAAVRFAADHDLDIAVQATGHGPVRPADDALLINTADMTGVSIDPAARTARVAAGASWAAVLAATQTHGLAPLLGSSPAVGAVGYTLGGGLGWLGRKYGLACDSVVDFDVVTADGETLTASADENADLFWGLRGGGGGLAVVTAMTIRLFPVSTVYGGVLVYPAGAAADVLHRWAEWLPTLPDEMGSAVRIINVPDTDDAPPDMRGRTLVMLQGCHCGVEDEGAELVRAWRDWRAPLVDQFGPMSFADVARISNEPTDPMPSHTTGAWLRGLSDDAVKTVVRYATLKVAPVPLIFIEIRHVGGAAGRAADSAFGYRADELLLQAVSLVPRPSLRPVMIGYTDSLMRDLGPALTGRVYMNFLEGDEKKARVRDGYPPPTLARLAALKAQYDPADRLSRAMAIS